MIRFLMARRHPLGVLALTVGMALSAVVQWR